MKIDDFFIDETFGYLKFKGWKAGKYLFNSYSNFSGKWVESEYGLDMTPEEFNQRVSDGALTTSVPPA